MSYVLMEDGSFTPQNEELTQFVSICLDPHRARASLTIPALPKHFQLPWNAIHGVKQNIKYITNKYKNTEGFFNHFPTKQKSELIHFRTSNNTFVSSLTAPQMCTHNNSYGHSTPLQLVPQA